MVLGMGEEFRRTGKLGISQQRIDPHCILLALDGDQVEFKARPNPAPGARVASPMMTVT